MPDILAPVNTLELKRKRLHFSRLEATSKKKKDEEDMDPDSTSTDSEGSFIFRVNPNREIHLHLLVALPQFTPLQIPVGNPPRSPSISSSSTTGSTTNISFSSSDEEPEEFWHNSKPLTSTPKTKSPVLVPETPLKVVTSVPETPEKTIIPETQELSLPSTSQGLQTTAGKVQHLNVEKTKVSLTYFTTVLR